MERDAGGRSEQSWPQAFGQLFLLGGSMVRPVSGDAA